MSYRIGDIVHHLTPIEYCLFRGLKKGVVHIVRIFEKVGEVCYVLSEGNHLISERGLVYGDEIRFAYVYRESEFEFIRRPSIEELLTSDFLHIRRCGAYLKESENDSA